MMHPEEKKQDAGRELEALLAEMARETPEMPADFHEAWTAKIREEGAPAHRGGKKMWIRALSTAAVFVFLIGGTAIYRAVKPRTQTAGGRIHAVQEERTGAAEYSVVPAAGMIADSAEMTAGEEDTDMLFTGETADSAGMDTGSAESGFMMYAAKSSAYTAPAEAENDAEAFLDTEEAAEIQANMSVPDEAEAAEEAEITEEAAEAAEQETAPGITDIASPEDTASGAEEDTEKPGPGGEMLSFFRDMGGFLLTVLPFLGAAGAALVIAAGIRRKRREKT